MFVLVLMFFCWYTGPWLKSYSKHKPKMCHSKALCTPPQKRMDSQWRLWRPCSQDSLHCKTIRALERAKSLCLHSNLPPMQWEGFGHMQALQVCSHAVAATTSQAKFASKRKREGGGEGRGFTDGFNIQTLME